MRTSSVIEAATKFEAAKKAVNEAQAHVNEYLNRPEYKLLRSKLEESERDFRDAQTDLDSWLRHR